MSPSKRLSTSIVNPLGPFVYDDPVHEDDESERNRTVLVAKFCILITGTKEFFSIPGTELNQIACRKRGALHDGSSVRIPKGFSPLKMRSKYVTHLICEGPTTPTPVEERQRAK